MAMAASRPLLIKLSVAAMINENPQSCNILTCISAQVRHTAANISLFLVVPNGDDAKLKTLMD
jgi:hypothetical protein